MAVGIDGYHILYSGNIFHQRNQAFVTPLDIDLQPFEGAAIHVRPGSAGDALQ